MRVAINILLRCMTFCYSVLRETINILLRCIGGINKHLIKMEVSTSGSSRPRSFQGVGLDLYKDYSRVVDLMSNLLRQTGETFRKPMYILHMLEILWQLEIQ